MNDFAVAPHASLFDLICDIQVEKLHVWIGHANLKIRIFRTKWRLMWIPVYVIDVWYLEMTCNEINFCIVACSFALVDETLKFCAMHIFRPNSGPNFTRSYFHLFIFTVCLKHFNTHEKNVCIELTQFYFVKWLPTLEPSGLLLLL